MYFVKRTDEQDKIWDYLEATLSDLKCSTIGNDDILCDYLQRKDIHIKAKVEETGEIIDFGQHLYYDEEFVPDKNIDIIIIFPEEVQKEADEFFSNAQNIRDALKVDDEKWKSVCVQTFSNCYYCDVLSRRLINKYFKQEKEQ